MNYLEIIKTNFIDTAPYIKSNYITSFYFTKKQNGETIGIVKTNYGTTYIKSISPNGTVKTTMIEIPHFNSIEERNEDILHYYKDKKYTQMDIAIYFGLSQAQVSNIINKSK